MSKNVNKENEMEKMYEEMIKIAKNILHDIEEIKKIIRS